MGVPAGAVTGLTPGGRYRAVVPAHGNVPVQRTALGVADASGSLRLTAHPVRPGFPHAMTPLALDVTDAHGATVARVSVPVHVRPGSECAVLSELVSWDYPQPPARNYHLVQQSDGNVVERVGSRTGFALWSTGTAGHPGARTVVQSDGNVVTRDRAGRAIWNSGTAGHPGATLTVQIDADIVIRDATGRAIWKTGVHD